jgi:hypothetical protein
MMHGVAMTRKKRTINSNIEEFFGSLHRVIVFSVTCSRARELCWLTILFQKSILTDTTNKSNMHKSLVGFINCKKFLLALIFALLNLA